MKINFNNIGYLLATLTVGVSGYVGYTMYRDAHNYRSVSDIQKEIRLKDPKRFDSLMSNPIGLKPVDFEDWHYEERLMNEAIKTDSLVKRAYFEGAQMVRDSIKNAEAIK